MRIGDSKYTIVLREKDLEAKLYNKAVTVPGYVTSIRLNSVEESDFKSYKVVIDNTLGSADFNISLKGVSKYYMYQ